VHRGTIVGVVGSLAAAMGIPAIEVAVTKRAPRAEVPGPHHLDGTIHPAGRPGAGSHSGVPTTDVVWLGDSLSSGVGAATAEESFPWQVATLAAASCGTGVSLTCLATPGAQVSDVLARQVPTACARLGPNTTVVVAVGANDVSGLTPLRRFRAAYRDVLAALGASGATVVCVGLPDISSAVLLPQPLRAIAGWSARRFDGAVRRMATAAGAGYVAIACPPPEPHRHSVAAFLSADRYHPNGAGYGIWASIVSDHLHRLWSRQALPSPAA
jgi:lysophospholipase L1-like esterase